jgi:hypothetical protein
MAYLVITLKDGRRGWFVGTDTRLSEFKEPVQVPQFDDEKGKEVPVAFAIDAIRAWRSYCLSAFGSDLKVAHEKFGEPLDIGAQSSAPFIDVRQKHFVKFTNGLGLYVTPGRDPLGEAWFVRAVDVPSFVKDGRHTTIESVSGRNPHEAAQRAVDLWSQTILFRDPADIAQEEQERHRAAQQRTFMPGIRPGDR